MKDPAPNLKPQEKLALTFEIAKPEDWGDLSKIRREALQQDPQSFVGVVEPFTPDEDDEESWKKYLEGDRKFFIFAKQGSEVVGFAGAYLDEEESKNGETVWHLRWAYVKPKLRNLGIGENIYRERLAEIKLRGGAKVIGYVLRSNKNFEGVLELNKKIGFKEVILHSPRHYVKIEKDLT